LAIEQAALSEELSADRRVHIFAWYNLVGSFATALGSLLAGALVQGLQRHDLAPLTSYRMVFLFYALVGLAMLVLFTRLSTAVEARTPPQPAAPPQRFFTHWGLQRSRRNVFKLASLFSLDAFAGGFVVQSFVAFWFHRRFATEPAVLGSIFFGANILAGISALCAARIAARIGLLATMVVTHIPSNVLLLLVPLMPNLPLAILLLLARFSISQMDVPTRQAYTMALVDPSERSAAAGITGMARTLGAALSPLCAGPLYATAALASLPFLIAGGLKIIYDLSIWRLFRRITLAEPS
jgi:MFS family permease